MAGSRIYTVTQLNQEIKNLLESNPSFLNLFVRGEVSNYKAHPSGHHYLTLKDEGAAIQAVLFRSEAARLRFRLANGMKVVARGRISSFPKSGQVQIYLADLMPDGIGSLHLQFEQRKEKLYAKGLFDPSHKRPIPDYPECVALITSPSGAAVQDMLRILQRRWPLARVDLFPAAVQGEAAPCELVTALRAVNRQAQADLILLGRGGGSMEDLWAFNDEVLAYEIYRSKIPVISAVGHEPDITIADFVADVRAATPSGGAELAVPDWQDVTDFLDFLDQRLCSAFQQTLERYNSHMNVVEHRLRMQTPLRYLENRVQKIQQLYSQLWQVMYSQLHTLHLTADQTEQLLHQIMEQNITQKRMRLSHDVALLDAFSPLKILARGYTMAMNPEKQVVTNIKELEIGGYLTLCFESGLAQCQVCDIEEGAVWQQKRS